MSTQICKVEYRRYGAPKLEIFSGDVKNGVYTNETVFTTPPITAADYGLIQNSFFTSFADFKMYGLTRKTPFLNAKADMVDAFDQLAVYVNTVANGDASTIAVSGFVPTQGTFQRNIPLDKISYFEMLRTTVTGQIIINIPTIDSRGQVNYGCICVAGAPLTHPELVNGKVVLGPNDLQVYQDVTKSRHKVFNGLTPGVVYYFYVFATNTVSVSPLSDARSIMAA